MNTSKSINNIYELIDFYKFHSTSGNRMELVVTPFEKSEGGLDDSKRMISIGLQSGNSKVGMYTFVVDDAKTFDERVLPQILSYYTSDDEVEKWDTVINTLADVTNKTVAETNEGNLFYYETFSTPAIDRLKNREKIVDERTTYKKYELTDEEKIWDEILLYANSRRAVSDIFYGNKEYFQEDEMFSNIVNLLNTEKKFSSSNKKSSVLANKKLLNKLLYEKGNKTLLECGFSIDAIDRIKNTSMVNKLAKAIGSTKRFINRLDINNPEIMDKLHFAIAELDKVDYYDKKNASVTEFEQGLVSDTKPVAINELKKNISANESNLSADVVNKYAEYCDSLLEYLDKKAHNSKKIVTSDYSSEQVTFEQIDRAIHNDYDKLIESIKLCDGGKVREEDFEIKVEFDPNNSDKRLVKVGLLNNRSKLDTFYFEFDNGKEFDNKFISDINELGYIDKFLPTLESQENMYYNGLLENSKNNEQVEQDNTIDNDYLPDELRKLALDNSEVATLLMNIRKSSFEKQEKNDEEVFIDYTADFNKLHSYALNYKIHNNDGSLVIMKREDGSIYTPKDDHEKDNIEFAYYWAVMAGVEPTEDDVFVGEKYAFNSENEKLFEIVSSKFREVIEFGKKVDLDSIKDEFIVSDVPNAMLIYDGLFRNSFYFDYVNGYYSRNIVKEKSVTMQDLFDNISEVFENSEEQTNEKSMKQGAEEQASEIVIKQGAEKQADEIVIKQGAEKQADEIAIKQGAKEQADEIAMKQGAKEQADEIVIKQGAKEQADELSRLLQDIKNTSSVNNAPLVAPVVNIPSVVKVVNAESDKSEGNSASIVINNLNVTLTPEKIPEKVVSPIVDNVIEIIEPQCEDLTIDENAEVDGMLDVFNTEEAKKTNDEELSVEEENNEVYDTKDSVLSEINTAYSLAMEAASLDNPASIKVHFDKNNDKVCEIIICSGYTSENEEVVYSEKFDSSDVIDKVLPELVSLYTENNEDFSNQTFTVPKPNSESAKGYDDIKCGLISLCSNENSLQITNATSSCIKEVEKKFDEIQSIRNNNKEEKKLGK